MIAFRFLGIPVRVQAWFFIIAIGLGASANFTIPQIAAWFVVMFVSVLVHELGHALVIRAFGGSPEIELYGMGGLTFWQRGPHVGPGKRILVSLAGPFAGIAIGLVALALRFAFPPGNGTFADAVFNMVLFANLGWSILNLLPMLPLDGGNVMASAFELVFPRTGPRIARWVSLFVAVGAAAAAFAVGWRLTGLLAGYFAFQNLVAIFTRPQPTAISPHPSTPPAEQAGEPSAPLDTSAMLDEAERALERRDAARTTDLVWRLLAAEADPERRGTALQLAAWAYVIAGQVDQAEVTLASMPPGLAPAPGLEGAIALGKGRAEEAADMLRAAFEAEPHPLVAEQLVRAELALGKLDEAKARLLDPRLRPEDAGDAAFSEVHAALHYAGRYDDSVEIGTRAFSTWRRAVLAFNNACSLSRAGKLEEAIAWLERAAATGGLDPRMLDEDDDLAPLRGMPKFMELRQNLDRAPG